MATESLDVTMYHRVLAPGVGERPEVLAALRAAGHRITEINSDEVAPPQDNHKVLWIQGNANWFPRLCHNLIALPASRRPLVVVWHSEPLPPPAATGRAMPRLHLREIVKVLLRDTRATDVRSNLRRIKQLNQNGLPDLLIVSTPARQEFLAECSIGSEWVPFGYEPSHGRDLGLERDIDALFLGTLQVPRRRMLLDQLRGAGLNVMTAGDWHDPKMWDENRTVLLNRTKIMLNLSRFPGELSGLRMILGMANRSLVLSEPIDRPDPYKPGVHYVETAVESMPEMIRYYLSHEEERQRIADAGHALVTGELTMQRSIQRIIEMADSGLASRRGRSACANRGA